MKRYTAIIFTMLLSLGAAACGNETKGKEAEDNVVETNEMYIKVGETTLTAVLENNESVEALMELLKDGELSMSASNYGGFEKVCSLGTTLPRNDHQTTTHAGDICLYNGNQIVIFYGSNSWAYTRIGKVSDMDEAELAKILSGEETEVVLFLD
ncbi:MAG: cyclophilin-like fold protein [Clostridium sp.]|nr:cyclophilin-like fold protein [Clostridium sp.]